MAYLSSDKNKALAAERAGRWAEKSENNNINQIAKHANETGAVYKSDVEELTAGQKEIQKLLRGIFSELAKIQ